MLQILFVCLGNICRSPIAEGVFQDMIEHQNITHRIACDSAGTAGYHVGELPNKRMRTTAQRHGITLTHKARQITREDLHAFDFIIAMDTSNKRNIEQLAKQENEPCRAQIVMMRDFDTTEVGQQNVPDPYYGGADGFEDVYQIVKRCSEGFLQYLQEHQILPIS
jgi:protein-tyrosine phosphatase